jgi:hypothetical protein
VYRSKGGPNLDRIILDSIYVHPLLYRASQIQLPSCLVCLDIPLGLEISVRGRTSFWVIDQQPEALDTKVGLHLTLPGRIVAGSEFGDGVWLGIFTRHGRVVVQGSRVEYRWTPRQTW